MLTRLNVKNFILIKELVFKPEKGLNVVTGETGAGKSILLGALGLVLGNRAETSSLLDKNEKCIVEAEFDISGLDVQPYFENHELDYETNTILRREIAPTGKSRAFINDTPVNLAQLKELGEYLIEIHTQHTGLLIANSAEQLQIIDTYAGNSALLRTYNKEWLQLKKLEQQLQKAKKDQAEALAQQDYIQYQFDELQKFAPVSGEEVQIENDISTLGHVTQIKDMGMEAAYLLSNSEHSALNILNQVKQTLKQIAPYNKDLADIAERIGSAITELSDLAMALDNIAESAEADPQKLEHLNLRLASLQSLLRKHNCNSAADLIPILVSLDNSLNRLENEGHHIQELEKQFYNATTACEQLALQLHEQRLQAAPELCKQAILALQELEIPHAKLQCELHFNKAALGKDGATSATMLFSANAGVAPKTLEKAASGGEISRLHFVLKSILAGKKAMPVLIFDEADTGVSGEVATKLGHRMKELGNHHQIIAITHLPQMAASGHTQFFVYKSEVNASSSTEIQKLLPADRVMIIAQMLSGKKPGEAALANARELLSALN